MGANLSSPIDAGYILGWFILNRKQVSISPPTLTPLSSREGGFTQPFFKDHIWTQSAGVKFWATLAHAPSRYVSPRQVFYENATVRRWRRINRAKKWLRLEIVALNQIPASSSIHSTTRTVPYPGWNPSVNLRKFYYHPCPHLTGHPLPYPRRLSSFMLD